MIFDDNLTTSSATIPAYASSINGTGYSDVWDFGPKSSINIPKGAKILVTLTSAMTSSSSNLKLVYGDTLSSGNISSAQESSESFVGATTSTQKDFVFHLDVIREKAFRYVQLVASNAGSANAMTAKLVLETPHNSGASI